MKAAAFLARAAIHAALAGFVIGVIELARMWGAAPAGALALVAIGLSVLGGVALGVPVCAALGALGRAPPWQRWWADARAPGPTRVAAIVRALAVLAVVLAFWLAAYAVSYWAYGRFQARGAAGVLVATAICGAGVVIVLAALAITPPVARWIAARRLAQRATTGVPGAIALAVVGLGVAIAVVVFTRTAAPAYDWRPVYMAGGFAIALGAATAAGAARRLGKRGGAIVAAAAIVVAIGGLAEISASDPARMAVAGRGTSSLAVLHGLWKLTDRDGDGFASAFGGSDCDDGDPHVNPGAIEIAGNRKDDNCAGGDLDGDEVTARLGPMPTTHRGAPRRNVILLTIDALRADHLGSYGYARATSPTLDALAARGARFLWASSPSPTTRRAIPALMTGRYASTIAYKEGGWPPLMKPGRHTTLGEAFKAAGYDTKAILCCTTLFDKASGNVAGIDDVDATAQKLGKGVPHTGPHLAEVASSWIEDREDPRPFYLWMHFLDAHNPYNQPKGEYPKFGNGELDRYDAEIAMVDAQVAKILEALASAGEADDTIILITGDHGDEFMEHGNKFHGRSLYSELLRVPLIVTVPGAAPQVIAEPVSLVDVGATLLDLVGLDRPAGQNGQSLAPAILGEAPAPDRTVLAELIADRNITRNLKAALHGTWKLIWDLDANTYELYSLVDDPGDRRNVIDAHAEVAAQMKQRLHVAADRELSLLPGEEPRQKAGAGKPKAKPPDNEPGVE